MLLVKASAGLFYCSIVDLPMYANVAGILPLIELFVEIGVSLRAAIAFIIATVGLSIPEATLLKKVRYLKLIAILFWCVSLTIIILGFLFNVILYPITPPILCTKF